MDHHNELIVGLDIGTTKICAIAGKMNENQKIEVLGMGRADSTGVMRGVVANIDRTVKAIEKAVNEAESQSGETVENVYVGIAGQHISSLQHRGVHTRDNSEDEINEEDVQKLINDMYKLQLDPGNKIIHVLPQEYIVDSEQGIKDPIGMAGVRLEANFHIITGQINAAKNINKCVEKAGLRINNMIMEPLASASAVLSDQEKEAGVALVDIGGGTTDIAIFQDGIIRHTAVIPFGGNVITEDIREGCMVMRDQAEQLKTRFGSALAMETQENAIISIPGLRGREAKEISVRNLASIIQARMEEIIEQVHFEIRSSGYEKRLIGGIVLTGGGAQLSNLVQLVEYCTTMDTRIGYSTEHLAKGKVDEIQHPMYATGIGLIIQGYQEELNKQKEPAQTEDKKNGAKTNWFEQLVRKGKEWLDEGIENDF